MARLPVSVWLRVLRGLRRALRRSLRVLWPGALLLGWILLAIWVLGPVNIYFASALLHEKGGGKARSAGHSGSMAQLCNTALAFFVRNPEGRGEININRPKYSCRVSATSRALDRVAPRAGLILQDPGLVPS